MLVWVGNGFGRQPFHYDPTSMEPLSRHRRASHYCAGRGSYCGLPLTVTENWSRTQQ